MTNRRKALMAIAAVLAVALVAVAIWLAIPEHSAKVYSDSMKRAELAFNDGDYPAAVLAYQKAIESDGNSAAAYEGLYEAYMAMGDVENARKILQEGIQATENGWLIQLLENLDENGGNGDGAVVTVNEKEQELSMNTTLIRMIGNSSYGDYSRKSSPLSSEQQADGSVLVRFREVPGTMIFRNTEQQTLAVSDGTVADSALPDEIELDDVDDLLGRTPCTREELISLGISSLQAATDSGQSAVRFEMNGCTVTVACNEEGTILPGAETTVVPADALARAALGGAGELTLARGVVIDAQSGRPVEDITLRFFENEDTSGDPLTDPVITDSQGEYEVNLPPGTYIAELSGDGYITTTYEVTIGEYEVVAEEDYVVTRELAEGEIRIVLEWGATPSDLDSHLEGETDGGTSCHVYFSDKVCSSGDGKVAELDLDDVDSFGPETTTIYQTAGKYKFSVHNYRPSTGNLEDSGATVTVYLPGSSPVKYSIGSDGSIDGYWWHVFTLDHGRLE